MAKYSKAMTKRICDHLSTGKLTVEEICKIVGIAEGTFYEWQNTKEEFSEEVQRARQKQIKAISSIALSKAEQI